MSSHDKYEYLSEYGTQILCLLSAAGGCTYLSPNFGSLTGLIPDEHLGTCFLSALHEDFRERLVNLLAAPPKDAAPRRFRCKLRHGDGKWYWYLFMIHPKRGDKDAYVCIAENIHDSILAQNTLQKAKLEAELALRARSEFLANMSHELRTPLNAVIGFSQIIESEMFGKIDNPHYLEYIHHIQQSGYDLLTKIEDLLEISNIEAGRVSLSKEEVHVSDVLRFVMEGQAHHASAAGITLTAAPLKQDILLYIDRLKIQHILSHLVANAIKFSGAGSYVRLAVARTDRGGLKINVRDSGVGIQEHKLTAIVSALKEDNCWINASDHRAIGLGLALTREFVALHGGHVTINSCAGEGVAVTIELPRECVRAAPALKSIAYLRQVVS